MSNIKGKLEPLRDKVFISDMNFDEEVTTSGIVLTSDNGVGRGVKPRWARVWAVGPDQTEVEVGQWIMIEHGRWTRKFKYENDNGSVIDLHMADLNGIMIAADEKPNDVQVGLAAGPGAGINFNIPGA
jgi:co-chaperonin GroES (HSP10)